MKYYCHYCGKEVPEGGFCTCDEAVKARTPFVPCHPGAPSSPPLAKGEENGR